MFSDETVPDGHAHAKPCHHGEHHFALPPHLARAYQARPGDFPGQKQGQWS